MYKLLKYRFKSFILIATVTTISFGIYPSLAVPVYADASCGGSGQSVPTAIDFGCSHTGNPITDLMFAVIRILADGVGIVVIASIVVAGIQYSTSRSDPQAAADAITRIRSSLIALLIYLFGFALLNWLIPGGFFNSS